MNLKTLRARMDVLRAAQQTAATRLREEQAVLVEAKTALANTEAAQKIIQQVAQTVQQQAHKQIVGIVSTCLSTIFDVPYTFTIAFERKRGKTEAKILFRRDGQDIGPMDAAGGGVIDVASFALRLACLVLSHPQRRRLLCLDEPFKYLSAEYQARVGELLNVLAEELGVQFVIVTHIEALQMGKVIRLALG